MNGETIKSFLVGLGFGVDDASLSKFNKSLKEATLKVTALSAAIIATAGAIAKGIADISGDFEQMGYEYHIIAPAINKAIILRQELLRAYSSAGVNIVKTIQASVKLNMSLAKTKIVMEAIYKSVGSRFFALLTKQSDTFRKTLYQNMPKIQNTLERFVKFIFKALEAVTTLGLRLWSILTRVYDFFVQLDKATDGWSTIILGVAAAWKLLNLSFLASPLGMILAGLVAILALYDDFKTFEEGGKSLFNWAPFIPVINAVAAALAAVKSTFESVLNIVFGLVQAFIQLFHLDFSGLKTTITNMFKDIGDVISKAVDEFKSFINVGSAVKNWATGLFGGSNGAANVQNNPVGGQPANPIGSNVQNSQVNQNVRAQTSITVQGSADANSIGRAVGNEQGRVNQDLVRNMKGATR